MPPSKMLIGGAAATAALGIRVARSLYGRWRVLPAPERERLAGVAEDAKDKALALRGTAAPQRAEAEAQLRDASESLAAALVETAESDPEIARRGGRCPSRRSAARARAAGERRH